jgi:hypothetical protein
MTHSATISITFTDYWISSTGGSGKGDLDMVCTRDADGCPMLPMTQVKGMLRETAEWVYPQLVDDLFGEWAEVGAINPPKNGKLRFSGNASLHENERAWFGQKGDTIENKSARDARAGLFGRLRSTRINEHGVAKTNSLRTAEVAVPLTLEGRIDWTGEDTPPDNWIKTLNTICNLTFAFGHGKNDGLGRAIASCAALDADTAAPATLTAEGHRLVIDLQPEDLAVFSRANANQGQQLSHAGPTGASLWGWAIGRLKSNPDALKLLLSGKISFSDAAPLIDDATPAFMRPSILFSPKQADKDEELAIGKDKAFQPVALCVGMKNYAAAGGYGEDRQAKALGPYHISLALDCIAPVGKGHRLRSAHKDGKAEDTKLFGYQHIEQRVTGYRAIIEAADGVEPGIWAKIVEAFSDRLFLGKARNNGYGGGYKVEVGPGGPLAPDLSRTIAEGVTIARIWCLSDMARYDIWGTLKVEPIANDFGLPDDWELCRTETSVTTRRYAPWDSAIQGHEREITVIEAGSVFAFEGPALAEAIKLPERLGDFAERGCGWIAAVPDKMPDKARKIASDNGDTVTAKESDLTKWALAQVKIRNTLEMDKWVIDAQKLIDALKKQPSKTQWSKVELNGVESDLGHEDWEKTLVKGNTLKAWLIAEGTKQKTWPEAHNRMARKRIVDHARRKAASSGRDSE